MASGHYIAQYDATWAKPLQVLVVVSTFIVIIQFVVPQEVLNASGYGMYRKDIQVDEDLPNFYDVLKPQQSYQMIAEAKNMR